MLRGPWLAVGAIVLTRFGITSLVLLTLFGFYSLTDGAAALVAGLRAIRVGDRFSLLLIERRAVDSCAGLATLFCSALTLLTLVLLSGFWTMLRRVIDSVRGLCGLGADRRAVVLAQFGVVLIVPGLRLHTRNSQ